MHCDVQIYFIVVRAIGFNIAIDSLSHQFISTPSSSPQVVASNVSSKSRVTVNDERRVMGAALKQFGKIVSNENIDEAENWFVKI